MSNGLSIEQFKGTPLYALAQNANVNGGKTLDAQEQAMFESQMKNMGWTPEQFGLAVESEEKAGESAKETRKNIAEAGKDLEKSYKSQFGKQGAEAAEKSEQRASSTVKTAYDLFSSEHPYSIFTPKSLGARPKYTAPEYKNDVAAYAADLTAWANNVKQEYMFATKLSNEELARIIMANDNRNAATNAAITVGYGEANLDETVAQGEKTRDTVRNDGADTRKVVRQEGQHTREVVRDGVEMLGEQNYENTKAILKETMKQGRLTRDNDDKNTEATQDTVKKNAKETQELDAVGKRISDNINNGYYKHTETTINAVGVMRSTITESKLPQYKKMELLDHLAKFSTQFNISGDELKTEQDKINRAIQVYSQPNQ